MLQTDESNSMFFGVLSLTYHSPITIESLIYRVLLGTPFHVRSKSRCRF